MLALTQSKALVPQKVTAVTQARSSRRQATFRVQAAFTLPSLPYEMDALEPKMSKQTFEFHYGKHHAAYVNNLNNQIAGTDLEKMTIEEVMLKTWNSGSPTPEFNNAAQVVNHTFFWESMGPNKGGEPSGDLAKAIERDFGSFEAFKDAFKAAGATQFGSGWAWLSVADGGKLEVSKTPNAENPWCHGKTPILTMDVWEHAYYLDVQNRRPDYISTFFELINWDKVAERYAAALA
jgi:Fe-Mn family superoxide dismutase